MEVQIPSPSVFLKESPVLNPTSSLPLKKSAKPRGNPSTKTAPKPATSANGVQDGAVSKPKQSKSRNGCMTCKKKRLKCDETKPSCAQCQKRNVACEGYKKDYKWRAFEETTFVTKPATKTKKGSRSVSFTINDSQGPSISQNRLAHTSYDDSNPSTSWSPGLNSAFATAAHAFQHPSSPEKDERLERKSPHLTPGSTYMPLYDEEGMNDELSFPDGLDPYSLSNTTSASSNNDNGSSHSPTSTFSSGSPQLLDLLLPGTDLNQPPDPSEMRPPLSPLPYQPAEFDGQPNFETAMALDEEFDEEIIREPLPPNADPAEIANWSFRPKSRSASDASSSSSRSSGMTILGQPQLDLSSPEMLMMRFDKQTCGILSIKDGPTENPWRTLIWPLARDSPALYHAICSMTAFHGARETPTLHVPGMAHMTKSIKKLAFEIENMRLDSALATSLALAFSEGWDRHVSTGIQHLRGAKVMVNNAMVKHRRDMQLGQLTGEDAMRLKFLCNTFVYMDVIARLTSSEEANDLNFEEILATVNQPFGDLVEVDPLMGCATTLFPLIGRVANLIQKCRKTESNSLAFVSQAMELKEQLQQWQIPSPMLFERPEDVTSEVQHSIQTAEAYRYATLLYLHQAVPEIPSDSAEVLSKRVLMTLASVPLSSRATIVQIFPLFAASCEVTTQEDRNWVMQRWAAMIMRLKIGNVDSCWNVVQEVWARRDSFEAEKADRLIRRYTSRGVPTGNFVPPVLNANKRKANTVQAGNDAAFFGNVGPQVDGLDQSRRPLKRRVTLDTMNAGLPMAGSLPMNGVSNVSRRTSEMPMDQIEPEYTIRGRLHWLGVMQDWQWEVFLG